MSHVSHTFSEETGFIAMSGTYSYKIHNPPPQYSISRKMPKYNFSDDELGNDSCHILA